MPLPAPSVQAAVTDGPCVGLLGGFLLQVGGVRVFLPLPAQRVIAYLCLTSPRQSACPRPILAERLWDGSSLERAHANLRTALWRIRQADRCLVAADSGALRLGADVRVDLHDGMAWADRLLGGGDLATEDSGGSASPGLAGELLPSWEDEWLIVERERVRQVQVRALDALAHRLLVLGQHAQAISAALTALAAEPLRESAQATLIDIHLAEGNLSEAVRQYDRYASLLWDELGLAPSPDLAGRIPGHRPVARR